MNYNTQLEAARQGLLTEQMKIAAEKENIDPSKLLELVASGQVVVPANKNHLNLDPQGIGQGMTTKINVNLGISPDQGDLETELTKVR